MRRGRGSGKPDPQGFLIALRHHRAQPDEALVFEDAESGLAAAAAAGIDAIHVVARGSARANGQADWALLNQALG